MTQIVIEIDCPDCGYNYYTAEDKKTKEIVQLTVGKCSATECELDITSNDNTEFQRYPDLSDLTDYVSINYNLINKVDCGCTN